MWLHSDTLFRFRANQYLLFLLNAVCLEEQQQIPILLGLNPQCTAIEVSMLTITPPIIWNDTIYKLYVIIQTNNF